MRESGTPVFSRAGMTASLTPAVALAYLRELSVDVRAAVVVDPAGAPVAGETALAAAARDLLAAGGSRRAGEDGTLLAAPTGDGGLIALLAGPLSLLEVLEQDLATTARALATTASEPPE